VSRAGLSVLSAVGLPELAVGSGEDYVRAALALVGGTPRLGALRGALRRRMARSPIMDGRGLAARAEAEYRDLWIWCIRWATR
jgi:predicted O-linked N-acetylglucosamine transferase (SPINDLY family)